MIDVSSAKYGNSIGRWCIAGRYGIPEGEVKVSQARDYFTQYMDEASLTTKFGKGYFVWLKLDGKKVKDKLCFLVSKDKIHSIWNSANYPLFVDNSIPRDIKEAMGIKLPPKLSDSFKANDITLLSIEEAEQLPVVIREFYDWWWLRSPGFKSYYAALVYTIGSVYDFGIFVDNVNSVVRPALIIPNLKSSNLIKDFNLYDEVEFKGIRWIIISDTMLLCNDDSFGKHIFDEKSNDYEKSEIKEYIHEKAKEFGIL